MKKLIFILIFIILGASGYWAYSEYLKPKYWYKVASFKPPNDRIFNYEPSFVDVPGVPGPIRYRRDQLESNKIKLDVVKDASTSNLYACIVPGGLRIMPSIPENNCTELSGYGTRKTATIYPTKVDKKQSYDITVEADGPWNATLLELK